MNPDGTGVVDLGAPGECATWSPNNSQLLYCSHPGDGNWAVWAMNADGSDRRQLTHPTLSEPAGAHGDYPGAWAPDGTRNVYSSDVNGDRELFLMNADGSDQYRLTRFRGADGAEAWLPDGRIVFAHFHVASHSRTGTSSERTAAAFDGYRNCTEPATRSTGCRSHRRSTTSLTQSAVRSPGSSMG
jgi:TolB protein